MPPLRGHAFDVFNSGGFQACLRGLKPTRIYHSVPQPRLGSLHGTFAVALARNLLLYLMSEMLLFVFFFGCAEQASVPVRRRAGPRHLNVRQVRGALP